MTNTPNRPTKKQNHLKPASRSRKTAVLYKYTVRNYRPRLIYHALLLLELQSNSCKIAHSFVLNQGAVKCFDLSSGAPFTVQRIGV